MKRFTKWTVIAAVALVIVVSTAGCTSTTSPSTTSPSASPQPTQDPNFTAKNTPGYLTYGNHSAGFTILYPPSWQVTGTSTRVQFSLFAGASNPSAYVSVTTHPGTGETLNEFIKAQMSLFETLSDYKLLSISNRTLAGYPSQRYEFTYTSNYGAASQGLYEATLANRTAYSIAYGATQSQYPSNIETAQNMIQSFNIVN